MVRDGILAGFLFMAAAQPLWSDWRVAVPKGEVEVFPRAAVFLNKVLLVVAWEPEGGSDRVAGVWIHEQDSDSWRQVLRGRFWAAAPAEAGAFWVALREGGLEKYSLKGEKLGGERLPQLAVGLWRVGDQLIFLRAPAWGRGPLLWHGKPGSWKGWALEPQTASDLETLTKRNFFLVATDGRRVAAVPVFFPYELSVFLLDGKEQQRFPLSLPLAELEAPLLSFQWADQTAFFLLRTPGDEAGRQLCSVGLPQGKCLCRPAPARTSFLLLGPSGSPWLVDTHLQVWEEIP